eukprot:5863709-Alexandrium_andersonii.AAC.1
MPQHAERLRGASGLFQGQTHAAPRPPLRVQGAALPLRLRRLSAFVSHLGGGASSPGLRAPSAGGPDASPGGG